MIERKEYLDELRSWKHEQVIKVVTGIRRSGKSTLLEQYKDYLTANGILANQIVSVNFEELENEKFLDYKVLYEYLVGKIKKGTSQHCRQRDILQRIIDHVTQAEYCLYLRSPEISALGHPV